MKKLIPCFLIISFFSVPTFVSASIQGEFVAGVINHFQDFDYETHRDNNGNGLVDTGDYLVAVLDFQDFFAPPGTPSFDPNTTTYGLTGVSIIEVTFDSAGGVAAGPGFSSFSFGPAPAAAWTAEGLVAPSAVGSMLIAYDDPPASPHLDPTTIASGLATATDGTALWEFGFAGVAGQFFNATTGAFSGDSNDIADIQFLTGLANLDVTFTHTGIDLQGHNYLGTKPSPIAPFVGAGLHDLQLDISQDISLEKGAWDIATNTNAYILPTPEPVSLVVWSALAAIVSTASARRRCRVS